MFARLRDLAPAALVPAAWLATAGAHAGTLGETGLYIAHVVMAAFITVFAATGWDQMETGALRAWRTVLVVGLGVTLAGIAGFVVPVGQTPLLATSLLGWMVLPAAGLAYTGRELPDAKPVYDAGAGLSVAGAVLYAGTLAGLDQTLALVALVLVGVGQTVGILEASLRG